MPSDANGNYSLPGSYFVQNGDTVLPVQHNPPLEDIAQALTNRLMKDGRTVMTGNLQMGGNRITNAAPGQTDGDVATVGQAGRKASFKTVAALQADTTLSYSSGPMRVSESDTVEAQGFRYEVVASDAVDHDLITAGGVKFYQVSGVVDFAKTIRVPSDYPTTQDALEAVASLKIAGGVGQKIEILHEAGFEITQATRIQGGFWAHVWLTSEDAVVPVTAELGSAVNVFYFEDCFAPVFAMKVDADMKSNGLRYALCRGRIDGGAGCINAASRGA